MNFIDDALVVIDTLLDSQDVYSVEAEANFALAYIMVAQVHPTVILHTRSL
jgi:hypothetical protein